MDDSDKRAATNGDADHVGHILKVSVSEGLGTVDGIDPDCDIFGL